MRKYWVAYNDDPNSHDGRFGTVKYKGKVLKSANKELWQIVVKKGMTFVWYYRKY